MHYETSTRSIVKSVSYRAAGTLLTAAIAYLVTGQLKTAAAIGGLEVLCKIALFYFHERAWGGIPFGKRQVRPAVIWFTGLPGSGKSTLSERLAGVLRARGLQVEHLDGDKLRQLFPETGFGREDRENHVRRAGLLARYLEQNGIFVIASLIAPYAQSRQFVRGLCRNFVEIHVSTPLEVCERRDPKGLYAKARRGEIKNFTGIDDPYEPPASPEIAVDTSRITADEALRQIMGVLEKRLG
jgi:adenylylsulfate kinase